MIYSYIKAAGCLLFMCLSVRKDFLNPYEPPLQCNFIGPGKVHYYFGGGCTKKNRPCLFMFSHIRSIPITLAMQFYTIYNNMARLFIQTVSNWSNLMRRYLDVLFILSNLWQELNSIWYFLRMDWGCRGPCSLPEVGLIPGRYC